MSTKDRTERCFVCRAMDLRVIRINQRLDKGIPILLMFHYVMLEARKNGFVKTLGLDVCLRTVRCGCYVLNSE